MGIENLVVRPRNWDEYGSKVKTDARDAHELCSHLDRYLAGNERALSYVVVSKDEDFIRYRRDADGNPRFIWVRTGNCKNRELIDTLIQHLPAVIELLESGGAMVEIFRQS